MDLLNDTAKQDLQESSLGWLAGIVALTFVEQFQDDSFISLSFLAVYTAFYFLAAMVIWYVTPEPE